MAAAVTVAPDWAPPVFEKSEKEKEDLINSTGKNILFSELESKELDIIIRAMKRIEYKEGDNIIEQGAEGDLFYVVEEGECEIFVKGVGKVMEIGGEERWGGVACETDCEKRPRLRAKTSGNLATNLPFRSAPSPPPSQDSRLKTATTSVSSPSSTTPLAPPP